MVYKHIQTELEEGVATLTLNRPPLNVLNIEMMEEINSYFESLLKEKALKLLVIQGAGKAFSAGVDVGEHLGDLVYKMIEVFHKMFRLMDGLKVPSISVVNGSALGGGCELAVYCDMVIATEKAKFGQPEIQVGVFPPIAALAFPRMIGRKKALELILSGDVISAQEALTLGMINKIVPEASLAEEVSRFVEKFKKLSGTVLKLTKEATLAGLNDDMDRGLKIIEKIYLDRLMKTNDAIEGLKAFLDKRKPAWKDS
ncbi:MAG TPA: enoyl-CoA hydratase/isomerase family protein [Thermodesulfobacteriota bacterium]|nr:enoyl-CoA hydratase/isomerase family protein [Thermodesulfobacteriota bacterium]